MTAPSIPLIEYQLIGLTEDGDAGDLLSGLDQKHGRVRLQALISEWLRMENLVVLTGSGTSVSAGGKTMANLETAVFETIEALPDLPASITPIIKARRDAVVTAELLDEPTLGFEAWLSFIANALVVIESTDTPFSGVTWPATPPPSPADLKWFVDRLRMAIFAECALSLPDTATAKSASDIAPQSRVFVQAGRTRQQSRPRPPLYAELRHPIRAGPRVAGNSVFRRLHRPGGRPFRSIRLWPRCLLSRRSRRRSGSTVRQVPASLQAAWLYSLVRAGWRIAGTASDLCVQIVCG